MTRRILRTLIAVAIAATTLTSCAQAGPPSPTTAAPVPAPKVTPRPLPRAMVIPPMQQPTGAISVVASGLGAPWSVMRLPSGAVLVSERDTARIVEVKSDGSLRTATTVANVAPGGAGGLMGLAYLAGPKGGWVYAMHTAATDNRIVRMRLGGTPGAITFGSPEPVLAGIPKAGNHNGGRVAFGPDGMLYATTCDAGTRGAAQDVNSLADKILRMTSDGAAAPDNPFGNRVWSFGHRNPQGIAWDAVGQLWAAEFGQNTWDELNRIERGGNYGWPVVEGKDGGDARFVDPVMQWSTAKASPSGLTVVGDTLVLAALRGQRIWTVAPAAGLGNPVSRPWFVGELGRIRDVSPAPGGALWVLTNNTDGRGSPRSGDDRLYRVELG